METQLITLTPIRPKLPMRHRFGAATLMTVSLVEIVGYIGTLQTSPATMTAISLALCCPAGHHMRATHLPTADARQPVDTPGQRREPDQ
jgi:hypothetical protein